MAIYELLTEYVFRAQPVANISFVLVIGQMLIQGIPPVITMYVSVQRRSDMQRVLLCALPIVLITTYVICDALLGSSFLGGGFKDIEELVMFLHQPALLREAIFLIVLFPVLSFIIGRWCRGLAWWMTVPGLLISWALYLFFLWGTVQLVSGTYFSGEFQMQPWEGLWYTYSLYAVLFQIGINIMALLWHVLFYEREVKEDPKEFIYDDDKCRKKIVHILLADHRIYLYAIVPLAVLLNVLLVPDIIDNGATVFILLLEVSLILAVAIVAFRVICPSSVSAIRHINAWPDGILRRRWLCQEYLCMTPWKEKGGTIEVTTHFLIRRTLKPIVIYLPDIEKVCERNLNLILTLKNGEQVKILGCTYVDTRLLKNILDRHVIFENKE